MYITHESYMYSLMFVDYYVTLIRACINYLFSGYTTYTVFPIPEYHIAIY